MVAINFMQQFADDVAAGKKTQTIRPRARCKKGDKLQLYYGQRTKECRKLRDAVCTAVDNVTLTPDGPFFGNPALHPQDKHEFAARDGFASYGDMLEWFRINHGEELFRGYVIMWRA